MKRKGACASNLSLIFHPGLARGRDVLHCPGWVDTTWRYLRRDVSNDLTAAVKELSSFQEATQLSLFSTLASSLWLRDAHRRRARPSKSCTIRSKTKCPFGTCGVKCFLPPESYSVSSCNFQYQEFGGRRAHTWAHKYTDPGITSAKRYQARNTAMGSGRTKARYSAQK